MSAQKSDRPAWPELRFAEWRDSGATLQLWTQIVGKVRLALSPWLNHWLARAALRHARAASAARRSTPERPRCRDRVRLRRPPAGRSARPTAPSAASPLAPMSVAAFYRARHGRARARSASTSRSTMRRTRWPIRSPSPRTTTHAAYDPAAAHALLAGAGAVRPGVRPFPRAASSARRARCISSGAASTSP